MSTGAVLGSILATQDLGSYQTTTLFFLLKTTKTSAVDHQSGSPVVRLESATIWLIAGAHFFSLLLQSDNTDNTL